MSNEKELSKIIKTLQDHEKRIKYIENLVKVEGKKTIIKRKSISDHLIYLKFEGFFNQPKTTKEIVEKLAQEGYHYPPQSLTWSLQDAVKKQTLGRIKKDNKWHYAKR